jgi:hypothetical protein
MWKRQKELLSVFHNIKFKIIDYWLHIGACLLVKWHLLVKVGAFKEIGRTERRSLPISSVG